MSDMVNSEPLRSTFRWNEINHKEQARVVRRARALRLLVRNTYYWL